MSDHAFTAAEQDRRLANLARFGVIAEVDLAAARARVQLDADWTSDFLPWLEPRAGSSLRTWSPPDVGEQVLVISLSGETTAGVILRGLFSDANPAPAAEATLTRLLWGDGARDDYDPQTHVRTLQVPAGGKLTVIAGATSTLTLEDGKATVAIGASSLVLQDGVATVDAAAIRLGGSAKKVARVGDAVLVDGKVGQITGGSDVVMTA